MAIWLCVLIGCFLSILTVAAEALPSDSGFTSMRTVAHVQNPVFEKLKKLSYLS